MADTSLTIVGAGVVGLAVASRLVRRFPDLVVLERHARHGMETSSRNSEVIHAGLFYPPGSLKALLCVEGSARLRELCREAGISHRITGKLVVATAPEEEQDLERIAATARENGALVELVTGSRAQAMEGAVRCRAALHSPATGVLSVHELMAHLRASAVAGGATVRPRARLLAAVATPAGYLLEVETPAGIERLVSDRVVNAAGLDADVVAAAAGIDVDAAGYRQHWAAGRYFSAPRLAGRLSRLVYPVPLASSLGIHAVLDVAGGLRFGPDIAYLEERRHELSVDPSLAASFGAAVRRYLPELDDRDLVPGTAGIRPKLQAPGGPVHDFLVIEESGRGRPGFVNLLGIESPGLTASLAIARRVDALLP